MRGLKIAVVVMGVMLVVGVIALIAAIAARVSHRTAATPSPQSFAAAPLDLPAGARIEAMSAGPDRLVLAIALPDGTRQLLVLDLATGKKLGTIPLRIAP